MYHILCTYVHAYMHNTKESLAVNLEIGKTNCHSNVIALSGHSALNLIVSQMVGPAQLCSAVFMFHLENARWQAAISSRGLSNF